MFRKSYRKLLRWNDEFPFAKFSVGEDERPLLAVELPLDALTPRPGRGGRPRPRPGADRRDRGPAAGRVEGLAVDRRPDAGPGGPDAAEPGAPRALRRSAAGDLRGGAVTAPTPSPTAAPGARRVRRSARHPGRAHGSGRRARGRPGPHVHQRRPLRRPARQPARPGHGRPDASGTDARTPRPAGSTSTTPSSRSWPARAASRSIRAVRSPRVRVGRRGKRDMLLRLDLGRRLYSGQTARYQLTFDLKDPGGAATRDLRIGDSLVSFPVWAFATEGASGSTVTVVFPKDYDVEVEAGKIPAPTSDARRPDHLPQRQARQAAGLLRVPRRRPARGLSRGRDQPRGPRGAGRDQRAGLAGRRALVTPGSRAPDPRAARARRPGSGWSGRSTTQPLVVQEAVSRTTGGYAGLFDPSAGKVEIAYYADDFVVLHEAAHAWFNGSLLADRWANEAFASYYATVAAAALERTVQVEELTDELEKSRIPLNDWGPVGLGRRRPGGLRLRRVPGPRASHRRARRRRGTPGRLGRCPRRRRRLPAVGRRSGRDRRRPAGLARAAGPARGADRRDVRRPLAGVGRARHRPAAARCARPDARPATTRS